MKKQVNKTYSDIESRVLKALESPKFRYRTATGIAKEIHLDTAKVKEILGQNSSAVRISITKAPDGSSLYALKKKVSATSDAWAAFKAINKAKFEG